MKPCSKCKQVKGLEEFHKRRASPDGVASACRSCLTAFSRESYRQRIVADAEGTRARNNLKQKVSYRKNRDRICVQTRARVYSVTAEFLLTRLEQQGHACKICKNTITFRVDDAWRTRANVDHCHTSGRVRGLLCNACNRGLACFQDNPDIFERAVEYLKEAAV